MAQLARLEFTIQGASGNAVAGASVEVRKQGAQVSGAHAGPNTTFNVDDPGAIVINDTVAVNTGTTFRTVTNVTATTIEVGGLGFSNLSDDDRLTGGSPTIYEDAVGNTSVSNPLTTDANGYASCFVVGGKYDVKISGGGATTRLLQDVAAVGGESTRSNIYSGTAWKMDSLRSLAATDIALDLSSAGTNKFKVMGDGEIVAGAAGATHALTGSLDVSNGLTVTGTAAATGGVSGTTGTFTGAVSGTTGTFSSDVAMRRILATKGTTLVNGDFALSAGWGDTATATVAGGCTDTAGSVSIACSGAGIGAFPTVTLTWKDGAFAFTPVVLASRGKGTSADQPTIPFFSTASGSTAAIFTFMGTPVTGNDYVVRWIAMDKKV